MQFNKVTSPVYTTISRYGINGDGSISATYIVGTGSDESGVMQDFVPITESEKWFSAEEAIELLNAPLAKEDIGKTPNEIMLDRIYNHLKAKGEITI